MQAVLPGGARCSSALLCLFLCSALAPQAPLKAPLAIPSDSKALIELAARINSLPAIDGKSWHIQASFENVGADGHSSEKGTFEEVWSGPTKFKRLLTSPQYTIVEYGSPNGVLRVGGAGRDDWALIVLHNSFAEPLASASDLDKMDIEAELSRVGSDTVRCVNLRLKPTVFTAPLVATKSFCFDPDSLFLRFGRDDRGTATASANPSHSKIASFPVTLPSGAGPMLLSPPMLIPSNCCLTCPTLSSLRQKLWSLPLRPIK